MNGWSEKDRQGEFTFVGHQGRSVVVIVEYITI